MKRRKQTREVALKLIFELSLNKKEINKIIEDYLKYRDEDTDLDLNYLKKVTRGAFDKLDVLDATIERFLVNWNLERISKIDLALLRLATYEINYMDKIPNNVSIKEALELSEIYSEKESVGFLNGVLDKISKEDKSVIKEIESQVEEEKLEKIRLEKIRIEEEKLEKERLEKERLEKLEEEKIMQEINDSLEGKISSDKESLDSEISLEDETRDIDSLDLDSSLKEDSKETKEKEKTEEDIEEKVEK